MSKRRLTQQQQRRIQDNQQKRRQRAQQNPTPDILSSLGPERVGRIITRFGKSAMVQAEQDTYRCAIRQNLNELVCGDEVTWQLGESGEGIIVAINPRKNTLARPDFGNKLKPVAANIDLIWIVASLHPQFDTSLIDQYTIAAEFNHISPALIINKIDLAEDRGELEQTFNRYQQLGYPVVYTSTKVPQGITELKQILMDKTSVFVGQSGVGKSSLINSLHPALALETRQVSEQTGLGVHTTSRTTLYHLPEGGDLIDSPGVREFGLWHLSADDIAPHFVEFKPFLGQCKFSNCTHIHEPDCAIRGAVDERKISVERFKNYLIIRQRILDNKIR